MARTDRAGSGSDFWGALRLGRAAYRDVFCPTGWRGGVAFVRWVIIERSPQRGRETSDFGEVPGLGALDGDLSEIVAQDQIGIDGPFRAAP